MPITYQSLKQGEEQEASEMIARSFSRFVAPDYSAEGIQSYLDYIDPEMLAERAMENHFSIIALADDQIVGLIEVRNYDHICLLFVDEAYQRQGISRHLLNIAIDASRKHNPHIIHLTVNSSPYAVPIYERLGFEPAGHEEIRNGIRFTPMTLNLN